MSPTLREGGYHLRKAHRGLAEVVAGAQILFNEQGPPLVHGHGADSGEGQPEVAHPTFRAPVMPQASAGARDSAVTALLPWRSLATGRDGQSSSVHTDECGCFFLQCLLSPHTLADPVLGVREAGEEARLPSRKRPASWGSQARGQEASLCRGDPAGPVREGFLEVVALGQTKLPGSAERPCVSGSAHRTEADGKSYVKYQVIGKNHVAVPTHFFKVLILEAAGGQIELRSYVMPNAPVDEAIPLERFLVPIESIERASGLLFVPNILARTSSLKAITAGSK